MKNCTQMISARTAPPPAAGPGHLRWRWRSGHHNPWLRASRWTLSRGGSLGRPHRHDFYEVFWVEEGSGRHLLNGEVVALAPGDTFFMRPPDIHTLQAAEDDRLVWTNVSFPARAHEELRRRYERDLGWWPWRAEGATYRGRLAAEHLPRMKEVATSLPVEGRRRLDLDWFVSTLLRHFVPPGGVTRIRKPPAWLDHAVARFAADPQALELGGDALVGLAGRCREHVNRTIREYYGKTTTELVRQLRLEQAARLLRLSPKDIVEVALECGFSNLSYFYRAFRARYGTTPRRFRMMSDR